MTVTAGHAEITAAASVYPPSAAPGEEFVYKVTLKSDSNEELPHPIFPPFDDFQIIGGPNQSTSFQIINGQMSREASFTLSLRALKEGKYSIQPSKIETDDGKKIETNVVNITIDRSVSHNLPGKLKEENIPSPSTSNAQLKEALEGNLFLRTSVSENDPYVGEPVIVTYSLYKKKDLPLTSINYAEPKPQFKEFLKEELYQAQNISFREMKIGNEIYDVMLMQKIILIPTKSGKVAVDPLNLQVGVRAQSSRRRSRYNDPFDGFFNDPFFNDPFGRNAARVRLTSSLAELNVKPLPSPKPAGFSGTVGDYQINAIMDRKEASTDDLLTLSITIQGTGAIEGILEPDFPEMEGFEIYETKAKTDKKITADSLGGSKTFDLVLRPLQTGELTVPPISYITFNPEKQDYETLETKPVTVNISRGKSPQPLVLAGPAPQSRNGEEIVQINADINYIRRDADLTVRPAKPLILRGWFLGINLLPLLIAFGAGLYNRRREALSSDTGLLRKRRAKGIAAKRLKKASCLLTENDLDTFYSELALALRGYFGDKFNREPHGLTIEEMERNLEERNIEPELIRHLRNLLEKADAAQYAPASFNGEEMKNDYALAEKIINDFEKEL